MQVYDKLHEPLALALFVATLLLPVALGLLAMRRAKTSSDFFVGGRAMNHLVVALSAVSSGRSSWLVLGLSGMAYARGLGALWAVAGYTLVELVQFATVGRRLREEAEEHDAITLLDWLAGRFPEGALRLRIAGVIVIVAFMTAYVAAQLNGGAKTLEAALGLPFLGGLLAAALLIVVYMLLGGYIAVAYNDVVRALIMLLGLLVLPAFGLFAIGGPAALVAALRAQDEALLDPLSLGLGVIVGFLGIGLGSPGQPHILVRYMSIDDPRHVQAAALWGFTWNALLGAGALTIGLVGRVFVPSASGLPEDDPEMVYLVLSSELFGPALFGLLVGGVFAAILSTADSQLLVVASTLVRDLWEKTLRRARPLEERTRMLASRALVLGVGLAAVCFAALAEDLVFWLVLFAWGGLGAALGPPIILALFWRRTSSSGVLAGMIVGASSIIVWKLFLADATGLYELIPAFPLSALAVVATSLLAPDPPAR